MADGEPGHYADVGVDGEGSAPSPGGDPGHQPASTPGAPDDEEMPLTEHVEEMVHRLGIVVLSMAVVAGLVFPFADRLINFLWFSFLPGQVSNCPPPTGIDATGSTCARLYHPLALIIARLKVAALGGFIVALPVFVYETYLFMRPGLYPRERKYYLAAVPTSIVLAAVGVTVAFFLILPAIFHYFLAYTQHAAEFGFGLSETFNLIVMMLGLFAFVFQIPLFVMLAIMMGVTTRRWLEQRRLYFWGGFLTVAFLFSPDPTGMAPFLVAATMIVLFEGTLALLRWTAGGTFRPSLRGAAAARPFVWTLAGIVGYVLSGAPLPGSYYDALPPEVLSAVESAGLTGALPMLLGGGILVAFEGTNYLLRRLVRGGRIRGAKQVARVNRVRRLLARVRLPVWLGAAALGYLASPTPALLATLERQYLPGSTALAVVAVLLVTYEVTLAALRWWALRRTERRR